MPGIEEREASSYGEEIPGGVYPVKFGDFFPIGDTGLVELQEVGWSEIPVLRMHVNIVSGELKGESIPGSVPWEPSAIAHWCECMGVRPPADLSRPQGILADLEQALKDADRPVVVVVNKSGWFYEFTVPDGIYSARLKYFSPRVGGTPRWYERDRSWQKRTWKEKAFRAYLQIVQGKWKGYLAPSSMEYVLERDENGVLWINTKRRNGKMLVDFLRLAGVPPEKVATEFSDPNNGLPEIEAQLLSAAATLPISVSGGWIDGVKFGEQLTPESELFPEETVVAPVVAPTVERVEKIAKSDLSIYLFDVITKETRKLFDEAEAWDSSGGLTKEGLQFCKDQVGPICDDMGLPRDLYELSDIQIVEIIKALDYKDLARLVERRIK